MRKQTGFTLVELMIVVAIIGVLSAISIPIFEGYQIRTARATECKNALYEIALEQEKFHQVQGTYTTTFGTDTANDLTYDEYSDMSDTAGAKYKYVMSAGTTGNIKNSFLLTCVKQGSNKDTDCGDLTLDNFGREGMVNAVSGSTRDTEACWR